MRCHPCHCRFPFLLVDRVVELEVCQGPSDNTSCHICSHKSLIRACNEGSMHMIRLSHPGMLINFSRLPIL